MFEIALLNGNRDQAHRAVDRAFEVTAQLRGDVLTTSCDIHKLLSATVIGMLESIGIRTVGDLLSYTRAELLRTSGSVSAPSIW